MLIRRIAVAVVVVALLGGGWWGWMQWSLVHPPRNVLLITIDTMRSDRLSSYGYERSRTPNMDRLAKDGVRFALAYCDIPWTTGSVASTMTSTFGPKHGVKTFVNKLPDDRTTMAEVLKEHGFSTGAVLASFATDSAYNLDQGFDTYDDELDTPVFLRPGQAVEKVEIASPGEELDKDEVNEKIANDGYRSDVSVADAAVRWLQSHRTGNNFLWVHFFGPHERFVLEPGTNHAQRVITDYDADTRLTDWSLGRVLDELDRLHLSDDTLVMLHSDHGQALREHGIFGHGHDIYDESVRVPMLMRLPGRIPAGTTITSLVRNVDIFPTVADFLGIAAPPDIDGRSLRPLIRGESLPDAPAYMELIDATPITVAMIPSGSYFAGSSWHGVRLGSWKYMNVGLNPPCLRNFSGYAPMGFLDVNPLHPVGGEQVPDKDCSRLLRQDLYEAKGLKYATEDVTKNRIVARKDVSNELAGIVKKIQSSRSAGESLRLDPDQERKLRSLGYLR